MTLAGLRHQHLPLRRPGIGHDLGGRRAGKEPDLHAGGLGILIPVILAYTVYAYWVFRGKVSAEAITDGDKRDTSPALEAAWMDMADLAEASPR
ncbi:MAG: hypothetical protein R3D43_10920 [Tepidamorphaceae bacterium]